MTDDPASDSPILQALQALARPAPAAKGRKSRTPAQPESRPGPPPQPAFQAQGQLPLTALAVQVAGYGELPQVVDDTQARALHAISQPAPFGLRAATLHDVRVRDSGEIDAAALALRWHGDALPALQAQVARALGLRALELRAHKLLVYGPGQFFKPHQDTEKHSGMVGTLVLVWPSAHIGGALRVHHGGQQELFASQHLRAQALRWCAFYADCRHEVLPVEEGWRVVLTFDLVLPADAGLPAAPVDAALLAALRARCFPQGEPSARPWVLLLDHEYSQRGLRWELLKGDDRRHVQALRAAAQELGLHMHLALAEIHESWTTDGSGSGGYRRRYDGEDEGYDDGDGAEPQELIDEDMVLDYWIDAQGQPVQRAELPVDPGDVECLTDTGEDYLVAEEYEGYMGNYGETLDYWYRRAALVLHTQQAHEASRFTTEFDAALADAVALARTGDGAALMRRLQPVWRTLLEKARRLDAPAQAARIHWAAYATLACAVPDADKARQLCEPFDWTGWQPDDAPALACLARRWGADWLQALLQDWRQADAASWVFSRQGAAARAPWPQPLPAFIQACAAAGLDEALLDVLLQSCLRQCQSRDVLLQRSTPQRRQLNLPGRLQQVAELAQAMQCRPRPEAQVRALLQQVRAAPMLYPLTSLRPLAQALEPLAASLAEAGQLLADVRAALQDALAQPMPSDADHGSHAVQWACCCADCQPAIAWAESPTAEPLILALAEMRRSHVQDKLNASTAQFGFETVRQGRPYRLVIRKVQDLPALRRQQRQRWQDDLLALG